MPPKRKPVQKEQKPSEQVATETALVSLENNEVITQNVEEPIDNPVEEVELVKAASKKALSKNPKKANNIKASELKGEENERILEEEIGKENVGSVRTDEETSNVKEKPEPTRRGARRGHPVEVASSAPVLGDNGGDRVGADVQPEKDLDNVEVSKSDDESSKKKEKVPPKRGARRAVQKNDAGNLDQDGNGDSEVPPPNQNESPKKKRGGKKKQELEQEAEPSKTRRGGLKNVQDHEGIGDSEENLQNFGEGVDDPVGDILPAQASKKAPAKKLKKPNLKNHEEPGTTEEQPEIQNESPKKKRGGKKIVQETEQEVAPSRTQRGGQKNVQDDEGDSKEQPENQNESPKRKRGGKKIVQDSEPETGLPRPLRGGQKNAQAAKEVPKEDHEVDDDGPSEPIQEEAGAGKKRTRKAKDDQASKKDGAEPEEKKSKPEEEPTDYGCDKENKKGEKWNLKISTWNVAGLRAWVKKNGVDYVKEEDADIICFQETKCPENKVPTEAKIDGYHMHWVNGVKDGYAGVALYSKEKPLNVTYGINNKEHDDEGRVITAEYEKFYLVTTYVPNSGQGLKTLPKRMKWDEIFRNYLKELDAKKPVILCGDLNVAHEEIDIANPKTNTKSAGFTKEERENMTALLKEGFVDSFRQFYPDKTGAYTFWTYMGNARSRNTGWRLDYFVVSERLMDSVCDVTIRSKVLGSDHCPVTLFLHI